MQLYVIHYFLNGRRHSGAAFGVDSEDAERRFQFKQPSAIIKAVISGAWNTP